MLDAFWIVIAFFLGLAARQVGLPPMVGYLAAGFVLFALGVDSGETLDQIADIGITLLLFSIGLKLRITTLLQPQVWAVASIHMGITTLVLGWPAFKQDGVVAREYRPVWWLREGSDAVEIEE